MSKSVLEGEYEDMADGNGEDNVCIQQILQEMTNEFNKGVNPNKSLENERPQKPNSEEASNYDGFEVRVDNDEKTAANCVNLTGKDLVEKSLEETKDEIKETKEIKENQSVKDEIHKKDGNIPRIVLTFRTIDENTDSGKKTKISSCSSNLTLVPDELVNCNQIGGVSVKIETSDENSAIIDQSDTEEGKVVEEEGKHIEENDERINSKVLGLDDMSVVDIVDKMEESKEEEIPVLEPFTEEDTTSNSPFIKKRRRRLRIPRFVLFVDCIRLIS